MAQFIDKFQILTRPLQISEGVRAKAKTSLDWIYFPRPLNKPTIYQVFGPSSVVPRSVKVSRFLLYRWNVHFFDLDIIDNNTRCIEHLLHFFCKTNEPTENLVMSPF
ncbi:hypothetical protein EI77_04650 [Prosthecobacter fusiformis]|uniref:Uncharacterized protein n=1 Tax=Prosthecobacter fusiformis TaxID=48464 RepID=A0A4R7RLG9_9BACT|nr:hypothetical protein EI77_04650 [Prosthecobacter fusiformis]